MAHRARSDIESSLSTLIVIALVTVISSLSLATSSKAMPPSHAPDGLSVIRLHGEDRFETSVAISRHRFPTGSSVAYLTRADQPTDAIALGNPTDGPLLLVPSCGEAPPTIRTEISRLAPRRIVVLGGENAVCSATVVGLAERTLAGPALVFERLDGASRFETAVTISRYRFTSTPVAEVNLIPDVDSIGALAAAPLSSGPLLFVRADGSIPEVTASEIRRLRPNDVHMIKGITISDVAASISRRHFPVPTSDHAVILANRDSFADAVTGGTLGEGPILFVPKCGAIDSVTSTELERLRPTRLIVLGGEQAICASLIDGILHRARASFTLDDLTRRPAMHRTVGTDVIGIWLCRVPSTTTDPTYLKHRVDSGFDRPSALDDIAKWAQLHSSSYFSALSQGRYSLTYQPLGVIDLDASDGPNRCLDKALEANPPGFTTVLAVDTSRYTGGLGSSGISPYVTSRDIDTLSASNRGRGMYLGGGVFLSNRSWVLRHEIGHMLHWPHSFTDSQNEYDNPVDLMSGFHGLPLAFNALASGWLDLEHVHVHHSGSSTVDISPLTSRSTRLALVSHPTRSHDFLSIEHRPNAFGSGSGIALHMISQPLVGCGFRGTSPCVSTERRQSQAVGRSGSLDHVLRVGQSLVVHRVTITVTAMAGDVFTVRIDGSRHD